MDMLFVLVVHAVYLSAGHGVRATRLAIDDRSRCGRSLHLIRSNEMIVDSLCNQNVAGFFVFLDDRLRQISQDRHRHLVTVADVLTA